MLETDHNIPRALGGKDEYKNLQLLHGHCHDEKTALDLEFIRNQRFMEYMDCINQTLDKCNWFWNEIEPISTQDNGDCLVLEVDLIEPLGRETNLRAIIPDSNIGINLVVDGQYQSKKGDRLTVKFDLDRLFIFDVNNGRVINNY